VAPMMILLFFGIYRRRALEHFQKANPLNIFHAVVEEINIIRIATDQKVGLHQTHHFRKQTGIILVDRKFRARTTRAGTIASQKKTAVEVDLFNNPAGGIVDEFDSRQTEPDMVAPLFAANREKLLSIHSF